MLAPSTSAGLAAAFDWLSTDLGDSAAWPHTLRLSMEIMLGAPSPMLLLWGPRRIAAFNAAYAELAGPQHPPAPGGNAAAPISAPLAAAPNAFARAANGEALHLQQALALSGTGTHPQLLCDLHLTPLRDEQGVVQGVLCAVARSAEPALPPVAQALRVLVVEDNLDSQYLVCEMLKAFGHEALGVGHAEGALEQLGQASFDVLFSDVSLPGMSGVDLARKALAEHPSMQVIFASGYGEALLRHVEFPFQSLQKPYEIEQLQAALARASAMPSV
ncbi:response regulator [Massilia sp. TSP1-1-2]|uniref:response regulator n=1 Tax=Massilia sp. TSP1-1-2 TaxID=2804649 RepID=UPI003CED3718